MCFLDMHQSRACLLGYFCSFDNWLCDQISENWRLTLELGCLPEGPILIFETINLLYVGMAKNSHFHGRAKHMDIHHHFVQEQVANGTIKLDYCPTTDMTADMMSKV